MMFQSRLQKQRLSSTIALVYRRGLIDTLFAGAFYFLYMVRATVGHKYGLILLSQYKRIGSIG